MIAEEAIHTGKEVRVLQGRLYRAAKVPKEKRIRVRYGAGAGPYCDGKIAIEAETTAICEA